MGPPRPLVLLSGRHAVTASGDITAALSAPTTDSPLQASVADTRDCDVGEFRCTVGTATLLQLASLCRSRRYCAGTSGCMARRPLLSRAKGSRTVTRCCWASTSDPPGASATSGLLLWNVRLKMVLSNGCLAPCHRICQSTGLIISTGSFLGLIIL